MITHVVAFAIDQTGKKAIGFKNKLLWHIPEELLHFKSVTAGKKLYMGVNTFRSIVAYSKGQTVLPGREIFVVCSTKEKVKNYSIEFLKVYENVTFITKETLDKIVLKEDVMIVGGEMLYSAYTPDVIIATEVKIPIEKADTFYTIDLNEYKLIKGVTKQSLRADCIYSILQYAKT